VESKDKKPDTPAAGKTEKEIPAMTAAQAAKLVKRTVPVFDKDKKPVMVKDDNDRLVQKTEQKAIKEDEVMNFAEYEDRVVVVTIAGEKLTHFKDSK